MAESVLIQIDFYDENYSRWKYDPKTDCYGRKQLGPTSQYAPAKEPATFFYQKNGMTYKKWIEKQFPYGLAKVDYVFGEQVWNAAQKEKATAIRRAIRIEHTRNISNGQA